MAGAPGGGAGTDETGPIGRIDLISRLRSAAIAGLPAGNASSRVFYIAWIALLLTARPASLIASLIVGWA
ncbi:MAG: hypothetical protein JWM88_1962 [Verrucomicrobia bacterium]|nr:hypothetical protein [Verrucomicrobiota bacterium]